MSLSNVISGVFSKVLGAGAKDAIVRKVKAEVLTEIQTNPQLSEASLQSFADKQIAYIFDFLKSEAPREAATLIELTREPVESAIDLAVSDLYQQSVSALGEKASDVEAASSGLSQVPPA
jgi:hypothetical protein